MRRVVFPLLLCTLLVGCPDASDPADAGVGSDAATDGGGTEDAGRRPRTEPAFAGMFMLGPEDYDAHVAKVGAGPEVVHLFVDWYGPDQLAAINADPTVRVEPQPIADLNLPIFDLSFRPGTTIALSWALPLPIFDTPASAYPNIPSVRDLLSGRYDDYIREFARALGELESPLLLTMFGEFDNNAFYACGPEGLEGASLDTDVAENVPVADDLYIHYGDPALPDGPERVRDAFIHVIDLFREEGVTQPRWFMYGSSSFMARGVPDDQTVLVPQVGAINRPEFYYPGDEYIDFVGKSLHHQDMMDLRGRFEPAYDAWGAVTDRPFFSPEFGIYGGFDETSRAPLIIEEFENYFPSFERFAGFANVDQEPLTGDPTFGIITLGGTEGAFPDEIDAWRRAVVDNPAWITR